MATTSSNKRQRTGQEDALLLSDLPDGILAHAASFLASPQKALFDLSMTASSESWANNNFSIVREHQQYTAAILKSEEWDVLDFEDIEKSLAVKLTDHDISALLMFISAKQKLRKLKLSGCIHITGSCLEVLRGSNIIEYIDLSLVKEYESPKLDPEPMISEEVVIPILDSIVSANGNSLKMIIFPKKWREAKTDELAEFLGNYNQLLESRESPNCSACGRLVEEGDWDLAVRRTDHEGKLFGMQSYCCYKCMNHFCYNCDEDENGPLKSCNNCDKEFCPECIPIQNCDSCYESFCNECFPMDTCDQCDEIFCHNCAPDTNNICDCAAEGTTYCQGCLPEASQCTKKGCNKEHCEDCELCDDPEREEE